MLSYRHISKLRLKETFIDRILQKQKDLSNKIKILKFLQEYFQTIQQILSNELFKFIHEPSELLFTLTKPELDKAYSEIQHLLESIDRRLKIFRSLIPPTMPFLNF